MLIRGALRCVAGTTKRAGGTLTSTGLPSMTKLIGSLLGDSNAPLLGGVGFAYPGCGMDFVVHYDQVATNLSPPKRSRACRSWLGWGLALCP